MSKTFKNAFACLLSFVMLFVFTACDNNEAEERGDFISGNKWTTSDGMLMSLDSDNTFKWYSNKSNRTDNYYSGDYEIHVGQEAVDYLIEKAGATKEAQLEAMNNYGVALGDYYILILTNKECVMGGKNTLEEETEITYCGFYNADYERFTMTNLLTGGEYIFTKM